MLLVESLTTGVPRDQGRDGPAIAFELNPSSEVCLLYAVII